MQNVPSKKTNQIREYRMHPCPIPSLHCTNQFLVKYHYITSISIQIAFIHITLLHNCLILSLLFPNISHITRKHVYFHSYYFGNLFLFNSLILFRLFFCLEKLFLVFFLFNLFIKKRLFLPPLLCLSGNHSFFAFAL